MAVNVLNTQCVIEVSVYVVRAFVRLREMIASNKELSRRSEVAAARKKRSNASRFCSQLD